MKHLISTILSNCVIYLTMAQDIPLGTKEYLDFKNGFKFVSLGDSVKNYNDSLKLLMDDGVDGIYDFKTSQKIGNVPLNGAAVMTYKGLVKYILIEFEDEYCGDIFSIFTQAYGNYYEQENRFIERYEWVGEKVKLMLKIDDLDERKVAVFISRYVADLQINDNKEKANKAINDL